MHISPCVSDNKTKEAQVEAEASSDADAPATKSPSTDTVPVAKEHDMDEKHVAKKSSELEGGAVRLAGHAKTEFLAKKSSELEDKAPVIGA